ncbi:pleiotropic drug resistance ABC transporter [Macrolepiota fuliginosa MF-IS2]|uniref:Pleiotropic drug resistance ABC transporter n=1 Tax=Macrolepiota fuliginosa MF-IS2 TaxID=1400762 RepID=A0A9P5X9R3_9AGAR|nr:pleiotropic drug resistance ABC transporter [Macrolepiota fuliginosa MF-IS2]
MDKEAPLFPVDKQPVAGPSGFNSHEDKYQPSYQAESSTAARRQGVQISPVLPIRRPHTHHGEEQERQPQHTLRRAHSHISLDYFDPVGFRKISRALSRISNGEPSSSLSPTESEAPSEESEETLKPEERFDFEKAVKTWLQKREEAGIKTRQLGVLFEELRVVGLGASASLQPTLGSIFNPMNIVHKIQSTRHPPLRDILTDFEGLVRPGEMLLVLGRPGSGCTTLLKTLANHRSEYYSISGNVFYDSLTPSQVKRHYRGDVQYCPEDDIAFPTLTVSETIRFAAKTRAPGARIEGQSREEFTELITDIYMTIFGLKHRANTLVGNAAIRGVSGGEKKRVSISETLAMRSRITSWDNSTRGLDASTALEYARALRIATDLIRVSTIVSIYQAGESLFELFDKVCVIYEGRMAYFGPASAARQYFIDMGYQPANRQTTPDFLVSVTDPAGRTERSREEVEDGQGEYVIPRTAIEFAEFYRRSQIREQLLRDMDEYKQEFVGKQELEKSYRESSKAEHSKHTRHKSPYIISILMQVRIVMVRRMQILKGNYTAQLLTTAVFVVQAVILGTTFVRIDDTTSAFFSRGGILFFSIFAPSLFNMSEIPSLFAQRPIVFRQNQAAMYHPLVEALAMTLVDIPFTLFTITLFVVVIYFVVGLQTTAWQFFTYYLFIFTVAIAMRAFFRALAAAFPEEAPAQAVAGIMILALSLYTGYQVPRPQMIGALRWISYINPIFYAFEALMANEFHTLHGPCSNPVPSGPGYENISVSNQVCPVVGAEAGQLTVSGQRYIELSFGYSFGHVWRNYAILCSFGIFFILCLLIFTELNTGMSGSNATVQFKRGTRAAVIEEAAMAVGSDEEKKAVAQQPTATLINDDASGGAEEKKREALKEQPKMTNTFSWQRLNYSVSVGGKERKLLDDIFGFVSPGKLTALMGESGAGKTTLLNVLAERVDTGVITGDRFFNGQSLPPDFQAQTGYCQQMDTHEPTSSVREALRFSARLRQPSSVPLVEKDAYADRVLEMCGLGPFADAIVGTLGVEERKRTTIGVELAAKPKLLLFLDEPTSGLDSQSAWAIVSFLRELANSGQAILCTIHQPSSELFEAFDRLLLLRKGGQTVYFGDIGKDATSVLDYFENEGGRPCNPGENPAEYILEVIGAGATAITDRDWHEIWLNSDERRRLDSDLEHIHTEGRKQPSVARTLYGSYATPWVFQTRMLLQRQYASYWRNPAYLMSKLALNTVGGLFIGFTFFKSGDSIQANQDKLFAIFMATVLSAPLGSQIHVPYINMRNIFEIRERPSRMYNWSALTTAQLLCEIPWNVIGASLFFVCWYWTVGFASSRGGFTYFAYGVQFPLYWTTFALTVASACPTAEIAGLLYSFFFTFVLIFNGVLQPFRLLGWWRWMYHLSPFTYLVEALLGQAIGHMEINCAPKEFVTVEPPSGQSCGAFLREYISRVGGYVTNPGATGACQFCSVRTTDEWMGPTFNIFWKHHWRDFGIFWGYIIFNTAAVYIFTYLIRVRSHRGLITLIRKGATTITDAVKFTK